jgi:predicted ArsR family transcriptional regulator
MARDELTRADPAERQTLGASRGRVLEVLRVAGTALGVRDVAERVALHSNTARFHLDGLVEQGLVERSFEERDTPGRPRALYAAVANLPVGRRSYRLLAQILTSCLAGAGKQPEKAALRAGEEWGRYLTERPPPFHRVDAAAATGQLTAVLHDIGFAPEPVTAGGRRQILLHHCPFREAAELNRDVVCTVHLGLIRGVLAELDAPIDATRLDPFVEPQLCVTHLSARPRDTRRRGRGNLR